MQELDNRAIALGRALGFATCAHRKQKRKYTHAPYVSHCQEVAEIVMEYTDDLKGISAAYLHDTLEDTDVTYEELRDAFSVRVADLVREVTNVAKPEDGNRQVRKELDRQHLANSSPAGATVKLADIISNTQSIAEFDQDFARRYLPEKESVLSVIGHGNAELWKRAKEVLRLANLALATGPSVDGRGNA